MKRLISFIFADEEKLSLENRLFLSAIVIGMLTSIVGSIMNFIFSTSITASIIPLFLVATLSIIYYIVRFKKIFKPLIFPIIIIALLSISVIWIFNGGINGSNNITSLLILILALIIVTNVEKYFVLTFYIILCIALYLVQLMKPDLIVGFTSETDRWIDSLITMIYSAFFIFLMMKFIHKNYFLEKLRAEESELRYRTLIESATEAIFIAQGEYLKFVNPTVLDITGYSEVEMLNTPFITFVHPDDRKSIHENYIKRLKGEFHEKTENIRVLSKNKGYVWIEISGVKIDWNGKPATLNFAKDVSEKKLAELTIKLNEQNLKSLINNRDESIWSIDSNYNYIILNDFFIQEYFATYNIKLVKGMNALNILDEELYSLWKHQYDRVLNGERLIFEFNSRRDNGVNFYQIYLNPIIFEEKITGVSAMSVNITLKKQAEKSLKESEMQFKSLFENAADAIFIANIETGIILNANKSASILLKKPTNELIGLHQSQLHPPEIIDKNQNTFDVQKSQIINNEEASVIETTIICSDNSIIPVEVLASKVHYQGKEAIMGIFRNITERKKNEEIIKIKNEKLSDLNATKDKFFSIIAHDLKNPLGNFQQITSMMYDSYNQIEEIEKYEYVKILKDSSKNLFSLLENLLDWSRSQTGKIYLHPVEFDLSFVVESTITLLKPYAAKKGIKLIPDLSKDIFIFGDINLISTVIRNLISNSIKFTNFGGKIYVNYKSEDSQHIISISDNGIGMSRDIMDKLFRIDVNITSRGTNNESGTGLGLILCKEFIEKHKGKIWVESVEGVGSTFYISLPIINTLDSETIN